LKQRNEDAPRLGVALREAAEIVAACGIIEKALEGIAIEDKQVRNRGASIQLDMTPPVFIVIEFVNVGKDDDKKRVLQIGIGYFRNRFKVHTSVSRFVDDFVTFLQDEKINV